ncbi:MAG: LysR family transcriptional regulator [Pseudomonadota bacterium]|jgi:DNA-binding transcriptional LysR family regulator|nr:LysR family transcriptional regulator [Pseudomonadota bacterium]
MVTNKVNWDDFRYVAALARHRSMNVAAKHLDINVATVSRRIHRISEDVGVKLFVQGRDGWRLTPEGRALMDVIEQFESNLSRLSNNLPHLQSSAEKARVTTMSFLATDYLTEQLGAFMERYPGIELEIYCSNVDADFDRDEVDVALRMNRPLDDALMGHEVGKVHFCAVQRPDSQNRDWIALSRDLDWTPEMQAGYERFGRPPVMRVENYRLAIDAAISTGLATIVPRLHLPENTSLAVIPGAQTIATRGLWAVYQEKRQRDPLVNAVVDWIAQSVAQRRLGDNGPQTGSVAEA